MSLDELLKTPNENVASQDRILVASVQKMKIKMSKTSLKVKVHLKWFVNCRVDDRSFQTSKKRSKRSTETRRGRQKLALRFFR
ncbi:uncharacterized protein PHALS_15108 [Plasmopara halstedii]|uniref:Uncharacterized protein n=1 Tax=Plasmopara halstedii TaxID=4781 RepID=A0A0P1B3W6_PLAHL|nr:uncharacterized protein PHALS_15108 [Plasmopara halstedii]CEG48246.1 hypothetical protein PHALS_15108 [Plasmopara halstedii]|eukprot:XP_024584615.1 hypothetical protein PHALS_15108 [Plasmopara halstedii]